MFKPWQTGNKVKNTPPLANIFQKSAEPPTASRKSPPPIFAEALSVGTATGAGSSAGSPQSQAVSAPSSKSKVLTAATISPNHATNPPAATPTSPNTIATSSVSASTSSTSSINDSAQTNNSHQSADKIANFPKNSAQMKNTSQNPKRLNFSLKSRILLFFLVTTLLSAGWTLSPLPLELKIVACDVGQGDAILIKYGSSNILIDSGPNEAVLECLRQEIFWLDPTIDVAIVTHWDADHIGGFDDVLQNYKVRNWLINPTVADTKMAQALYSQIGTRVKTPLAGDVLVWPGLEIRVLWSELTRGNEQDKTTADRNLDSIAVLIKGESFGFFSAADLECPQQLAIIHSHLLNQTQIVKVAHHGAKLGSCPELWSNLRPEVAILSVGQGNSYGHPHPQTLEHLAQNGIFAWRTDEFGQLSLQWEPSIGWLMPPL